MSVMTDFERLPKPTSISAYFDVIRFWLKDPLDRRRLSELQHLCSGRLRADTEPAKFAPRTYHQRITLRQPSDSALKWLNEHCADAFINYVEIAIDWGFHDGTSRDDTFEFFLRHFCRRHHGRKQQVRFYTDGPNGPKRRYDIDQAQTRYDAGRSAPNRTVFYKESVSRQTGEIIPLLHTEWRTSGVNAVKRLGIRSTADLVRFDHHGFWARRLLLLDASPGRLGRFIHNCNNAKKSRVETPVDRRVGYAILKKYNTIQELIDALGPRYRIRRALTEISNDAWLPDPAPHYSNYEQEPPTHSSLHAGVR